MNHGEKLIFLTNFAFYSVIIVSVVAILMFLPILMPFWVALILAVIFNKISNVLKQRFSIKSKLSTILSALIFFFVSAIIFWIIINFITVNILDTISSFPSFFEKNIVPLSDEVSSCYFKIISFFTPNSAVSEKEIAAIVNSALSKMLSGFSQSLLSAISCILKNLPIFIVGFIFMIASSFYIALDYNNLCKFANDFTPQYLKTPIKKFKTFLSDCLLKIFKAYGILMVITFLELSAGFFALGIDNFFKIAGIIAVLDILPILGTGGILIPWGICKLINHEIFLGAGLLLLYAIVAVVRNILEPRFIGKQLGLHPVVSFIAVFLGLKFMGLLGIIVFPIIFLMIKHFFSKIK